ncbi:hypothetical protein HanHA300_Chr16g0597961 [Helianthus annuus]|nr:hypothetical protein HanHA300_Chr16g0597961 [Helianthus annuus]KAJ0459390.1 hypothetical protein HanHA89_Chr16g0648421 [Helianthus annuus]KAJ0639921.1 hypothetical protein HanLR1_Chr16g0609271 [Helianthus annuus]KAJ0643880.1 hypothetical protein HanOQP8_Chr16g0605521 [Helianthus annuus]
MYITACEIYDYIDMYIYKEFQKPNRNKAQAYVSRFLYQESLFRYQTLFRLIICLVTRAIK